MHIIYIDTYIHIYIYTYTYLSLSLSLSLSVYIYVHVYISALSGCSRCPMEVRKGLRAISGYLLKILFANFEKKMVLCYHMKPKVCLPWAKRGAKQQHPGRRDTFQLLLCRHSPQDSVGWSMALTGC